MTVQKMKKDRVIKFDSKERILKKARSYVESVETFFDENDRAGNWGQRIFLISSEPANPTCGRLQRDITLEFQMQYETAIYPSE